MKEGKKKNEPEKVQYCRHTVPHPQAHAVSHSVAQGDQRQFSHWPKKPIPNFRFADPNPNLNTNFSLPRWILQHWKLRLAGLRLWTDPL